MNTPENYDSFFWGDEFRCHLYVKSLERNDPAQTADSVVQLEPGTLESTVGVFLFLLQRGERGLCQRLLACFSRIPHVINRTWLRLLQAELSFAGGGEQARSDGLAQYVAYVAEADVLVDDPGFVYALLYKNRAFQCLRDLASKYEQSPLYGGAIRSFLARTPEAAQVLAPTPSRSLRSTNAHASFSRMARVQVEVAQCMERGDFAEALRGLDARGEDIAFFSPRQESHFVDWALATRLQCLWEMGRPSEVFALVRARLEQRGEGAGIDADLLANLLKRLNALCDAARDGDALHPSARQVADTLQAAVLDNLQGSTLASANLQVLIPAIKESWSRLEQAGRQHVLGCMQSYMRARHPAALDIGLRGRVLLVSAAPCLFGDHVLSLLDRRGTVHLVSTNPCEEFLHRPAAMRCARLSGGRFEARLAPELVREHPWLDGAYDASLILLNSIQYGAARNVIDFVSQFPARRRYVYGLTEMLGGWCGGRVLEYEGAMVEGGRD